MSGLKLETADLRHRHGIFRSGKGHIRIRIPDISHHENRTVIGFHDLSYQGGGGGLAVGSRNRHYPALRKAIGKLDLPPYGDPLFPVGVKHRGIYRNTGAYHHQNNAFLFFFRHFSHKNQKPFDPACSFPDLLRTELFIAVKKHRDTTRLSNKPRGAYSAFAASYHQNLFILQIYFFIHDSPKPPNKLPCQNMLPGVKSPTEQARIAPP